jgi:hypothetical protein
MQWRAVQVTLQVEEAVGYELLGTPHLPMHNYVHKPHLWHCKEAGPFSSLLPHPFLCSTWWTGSAQPDRSLGDLGPTPGALSALLS